MLPSLVAFCSPQPEGISPREREINTITLSWDCILHLQGFVGNFERIYT